MRMDGGVGENEYWGVEISAFCATNWRSKSPLCRFCPVSFFLGNLPQFAKHGARLVWWSDVRFTVSWHSRLHFERALVCTIAGTTDFAAF